VFGLQSGEVCLGDLLGSVPLTLTIGELYPESNNELRDSTKEKIRRYIAEHEPLISN
jgi:hypothetical protein